MSAREMSARENCANLPPGTFPESRSFSVAIVIKIGEEFAAALGVSGAPGGEKDEACARAALDKVSAQIK
jgi:Haem-degrading